ncbi:MAG: hypothetical protein ACOVOG_00825, partial [Rubrivivax sp.]
MKSNFVSSTRPVDRLFLVAVAVNVALAMALALYPGRPVWWASLLALPLPMAAWLWRFRGGTALAAWGLSASVVASALTLVTLLPDRPAVLGLLLVMMCLLPWYRRWQLP